MSTITLEAGYFPRLTYGPQFLEGEDMKFEALRLKTFEFWTAFEGASPLHLARAGFVYTGNSDVVKCYVCQLSKGGWNRTMNPLVVHQELNPDCGFCKGLEGINIPVFVPTDSIYQEIQDNLHRRFCGSSTPAPSLRDHAPDESSAAAGPPRQMNYPVVATDSGTMENRVPTIGIGQRSLGHDSEAAPTREEFAPMKYELKRFESFNNPGWSADSTPDARDLARAGFYYTGTVDRVQCAFCRGILRNWDADDVPMEEHRRHFPMCPLVLGLDSGNVPDPTAIITANRTSEFMNVTQPTAAMSDAALGIVTERPKHPQYAVEAARVNSYRDWPSEKEQTPSMLARAGFFYAGFGDSVKCFFCDGGLRTWEEGDDPWMEHARWFPRCPYVRQVKGEDFINLATHGHELPDTTGRLESLEPAVGETRTKKPSKATVRQVDPRELSARMDSPMVQTVLSMDIPRDRVSRAIQQRLHETGDDFPSIEALMEAIFLLPDETPATTSAATGSDARPDSEDIGEKGDCETDPKSVNLDDVSDEDEDSQSLIEENRALKEQRQCKICMDEEVNVVFLPCGHLVCCATCAPALRKCPICRANIRGTVRTFMS